MFNFCVLLIAITALSLLTLVMLRIGKEAACIWLALLGVAMNLFVLKQVQLLGLTVTASEALAVGYLLTLNLIQEFYGRRFARHAARLTLLALAAFFLLSRFHLLYRGSGPDYEAILSPLPRLLCASVATFFTVQLFDLSLFSYLRMRWSGRFLELRTALTLLISETIDTFLFTFLGLWGVVDSPLHIALFTLIVKGVITLLHTPFISLSKKVVHV